MSVQTHVHVIDGKTYTYPNNACPLCNPQTQQQPPRTQGASAYTKGNTVVLKFSSACILTANWWDEGKNFLVTMSQIARDPSGKLLRDQKNAPIWNKITRRVSLPVLKTYCYELSKLVNAVESGQHVPRRD